MMIAKSPQGSGFGMARIGPLEPSKVSFITVSDGQALTKAEMTDSAIPITARP
jgi:hypothetical protein